jgi:hypothetical protein
MVTLMAGGAITAVVQPRPSARTRGDPDAGVETVGGKQGRAHGEEASVGETDAKVDSPTD